VRSMRTGCLAVLCACFLAVASGGANGEERPEPLPFGVVNQRSIALMAAYWNPILEYVSRTSAVPLKLGMGKTSEETTRMMVRGDFAFVFTNRLFTPARVSLGYRVIARPDCPGVQGNVVVRGGSPIRSLEDLGGKTVAFPSREAFFGYWLPMDAILRAKIAVQPIFAGNQEGALAQLEAGRVDAAAVNGSIMHGYARRMKLEFRVIWESAVYPDHCIMAAPTVPRDVVAAIRNAFIGMSASREGRAVLASVAEGLGLAAPVGFVEARDAEYEPYRRFFRGTLVKE
jgi:phosphonate transport system substrate-binding protein